MNKIIQEAEMVIREGETAEQFETRKQQVEEGFVKVFELCEQQYRAETDPIKREQMRAILDEAYKD